MTSDWRQPVQYLLTKFAQTVNAGGHTFHGFNIVAAPVSGPDGIAWEFTGQAIAAMRYVDTLYSDTQFELTADFYLDQIDQAQARAPFGNGEGLVASTIEGGDTLPLLQQCLNTPFQCIAERVGLAATTWAILAENKLNIFIQEAQPHSCIPGNQNLCFHDNRFFVEVDYSTPLGDSGKAPAVPLTSDSGYFWFFHDSNVELLVKILDGREINGHFWFFWGAMTDVQYTITVIDMATGAVRTYEGEQGVQKSGNDTDAF